MSEENQNEDKQPDEGSTESHSGSDSNDMTYPKYLMAVFNRPDEMLDGTSRGLKMFGLINMGALVVLIALSSFVQRIAMTTTSGVRFSWLVNGIKFGLSFAIPIAIVVYLFSWYAKRQGNDRGLDFFMEKFGAAMALPAVLVAIAMPLNLLGITMHSWFRASGLIFIYITVFLISYLYVAPQRIKVAVVFAFGFYFAYRLIWLLM